MLSLPASSAGGVIDFDRSYGGADARLQFDGQRWRATMGTSMDRQRDDRRGYENFAGSGASRVLGVTGNLRRNEINNATSSDMYAQGEYYLTDTWTLSGGLRSGRVRLESNDRYLTNGDDSGSVSYDYVTPVAALRWQPDSNLSVYVSAGQGYETPTLNEVSYRPNGQAGLNTSLRAQRSNQVEVGAKWRSDDGVPSREASAFGSGATLSRRASALTSASPRIGATSSSRAPPTLSASATKARQDGQKHRCVATISDTPSSAAPLA